MKNLSIADIVAIGLVVIGGLNWGLVGLFKYDLVASIFGDLSSISRVVYTLVGFAAVYLAIASMGYARK